MKLRMENYNLGYLSLKLIIFISIFLLIFNYSVASSKSAVKFVHELSNQVISIIKREDINNQIKGNKLADIFKQNVDTNWIGKFALGRYWKSATDEQQKQYVKVFTDYITLSYTNNFSKYISYQLKILNVIETANNEYLVQTEMVEEDSGNTIKVNYRLIKKDNNNNFIIFDIIAEGVSLIATKRAEFNGFLANSNIHKLIEMLENKVIQLSNDKSYY